jgi:transcriptional regulator with XRE-family HTH domain
MQSSELKRQRMALGLTQPRLAANLGVSLRTLKEWEAGVRTIRPMVEMAMCELMRRLKRRQLLPVPKSQVSLSRQSQTVPSSEQPAS